jgi:hypothetical protein
MLSKNDKKSQDTNNEKEDLVQSASRVRIRRLKDE